MSKSQGRFWIALVATVAVAALSGTVSWSGEKWYPSGTWFGTAPSCSGSCGSNTWVYCVTHDGGCDFSEYAGSPPGFGADCSTGRKAYCVSTPLYQQVTDYTRLNAVGVWRGLAPACSSECNEGEFALCRDTDGSGSCSYGGDLDPGQLSGFGATCSTGHKVFCVPIEYIHTGN